MKNKNTEIENITTEHINQNAMILKFGFGFGNSYSIIKPEDATQMIKAFTGSFNNRDFGNHDFGKQELIDNSISAFELDTEAVSNR
jgi:hypothetical protein